MKYALTLSRWHKVAERIKAAIKEREARVVVELKASETAARGKADVALIESGLSAVAAIRAALARRNAELGIGDKLAEADAVSRRAALYLAIVGKRGIADRPFVEELALKLAADQARAHALLDQVAELNRSKLELELPDELTIIAGLAG